MKIKHVIGTVKAVGGEGGDFDIEVVCSSDAVDRGGEVIHQDGWVLDNFKRNPVFLAAHMHRLDSGRSPVIGSFQSIGVDAKQSELLGRVKFADTDLGREYRTLYRDRHMRAVSVGFQPMDGEPRPAGKGEKGGTVYHHTRQELYEVSAVAVGCNQEALARLRELGLLADRSDADGQGLAGAVEKAAETIEALKAFFNGEITTQTADLKAFLLEQLDEIKAFLPEHEPLPDGGGARGAGHANPADDERADAAAAEKDCELRQAVADLLKISQG